MTLAPRARISPTSFCGSFELMRTSMRGATFAARTRAEIMPVDIADNRCALRRAVADGEGLNPVLCRNSSISLLKALRRR